MLRGGTFQETLSPPRSGAFHNYISFKSYPGETATLSGVNEPAIFLLNRSYLIIEGLTVTDVLGWGRVESSNNIIFRNNRFSRATARGTTGGLKFVKSRYNFVVNNTFDEGNDSLVLQESDRNRRAGQHVHQGAAQPSEHPLRKFQRDPGQSVPQRRSEGRRDLRLRRRRATPRSNSTPPSIISSRGTRSRIPGDSSRDYRYNGIQYGGQNGIVRRNVFYAKQGGALNFQVYPDEALYNNGNHVFNNTFYNNRCYGMSASSASGRGRYFGNIVKNNIFYKNTDCSGGANQTSIGNTTAVKLESNAILDGVAAIRGRSAS